MRTICTMPDCDRVVAGWGLCHKHYMQEYRAGRIARPTAEDRFWRKVVQSSGCWQWLGSLRKGYGTHWVDGRHVLAHRYAYQLLVGAIPDGLTLDHQCHTNDPTCAGGPRCPHRSCVNPDHLIPMDAVVNSMSARNSPTVINADKTACIRGHLLGGDNLIVWANGHRECRTCRRATSREASRRYAARKRAAS